MVKNDSGNQQEIDRALKVVFQALKEKGYEPLTQIWGYLKSEDPIYITNYNNARTLITELDVEDVGKYLLRRYFEV